MRSRFKAIFPSLLLAAALLAGCGDDDREAFLPPQQDVPPEVLDVLSEAMATVNADTGSNLRWHPRGVSTVTFTPALPLGHFGHAACNDSGCSVKLSADSIGPPVWHFGVWFQASHEFWHVVGGAHTCRQGHYTFGADGC